MFGVMQTKCESFSPARSKKGLQLFLASQLTRNVFIIYQSWALVICISLVFLNVKNFTGQRIQILNGKMFKITKMDRLMNQRRFLDLFLYLLKRQKPKAKHCRIHKII